jgi:hypothetical protein
MAMNLEEFQLVMLRRARGRSSTRRPRPDPAGAPDYYAGLRGGLVVTNGPVLDQPDERLRGLVLHADSVAEAREIAEATRRCG